MSRLQQWLDTETYNDVRGWIQTIVSKFQRKYGGDYYELLAEANFLFALHLKDYDPERSSLTYFLEQRIRGGLIDYNKKKWKHPEAYIEELHPSTFISRRQHTFLVDLLDSIGRDARTVVQKILQPDPILMMILQRKDGLRAARRGLREYFNSKHSWSQDRIDDAFWDLTVSLWNIEPFKRN